MPSDERLNALTVDVEDYFHVAALSDAIDRSDWPKMPTRVDRNTRRLLDLFDERSVRGTFFVLGWVAERFPDLVREIGRRGHEVACHGMSHALIYDQTPEQFEVETRRSKAVLEDVTGERIIGYRAASYSITERSLWALDIILDAGFEYDSSIVPARHDLYGIPGAEPMPHRLLTPSGRQIVEFPPTTIKIFGQSVPVGGGGYFRIYPYALTRYLLTRAMNGAQPFIFYIHPWEIDPDQPRVAAGPLSRFRHYVNLSRCEGRLIRLLEDFRFDTVQAALQRLALLPANEVGVQSAQPA